MREEAPTACRAAHAVYRAVPLLLGALLLFVAAGPTVGQADLPQSLRVPQYTMPSPNGYAEFESLAKDFDTQANPARARGTLERLPTPEEERQAELAAIQRNADKLARLPEILRMEWLYPRELTPGLLFPELAKARSMVILLSRRGSERLNAGDVSGAIADLEMGLRLGVKLPRGGTFTHWLVELACDAIVFKQLEPIIASGQLDRATLESLLADLDRISRECIPLREAIAFDFQYQGSGATKLKPEEVWELIGFPPEPIEPSERPDAEKFIGVFVDEFVPPLRAFDAKMAELSTYPFYQVRDRIPGYPEDCFGPDNLIFVPVNPLGLRKKAERECQWRATRIAIVLELARKEGGQYPEGIGGLEGLSREDETDPFSGKAFGYGRTPEGYLLYSTGHDGVDNGGKRAKTGQVQDGEDYVLWPVKPA